MLPTASIAPGVAEAAMSMGEILALGAIAGFTVFLGLPLGRMRNASTRMRSLLNAGATGILLFLFIWVRGTLPRFRYDQLMRFAWTVMFPVAMLNLLVTSFLVAIFPNNP